MTKTKESLRSPMGAARGLGSAKDGTHHWWMQRVSSIALIPLSGYFLCNLDRLITPNYGRMMTFLADPPVTIALILFILCAYYHAWLGMQVIIEDYVHGKFSKPLSLILNQLFFLVIGVAAIYAALTIGFNFSDYAVQLEN